MWSRVADRRRRRTRPGSVELVEGPFTRPRPRLQMHQGPPRDVPVALGVVESGRRGSNPRPSAWKARFGRQADADLRLVTRNLVVPKVRQRQPASAGVGTTLGTAAWAPARARSAYVGSGTPPRRSGWPHSQAEKAVTCVLVVASSVVDHILPWQTGSWHSAAAAVPGRFPGSPLTVTRRRPVLGKTHHAPPETELPCIPELPAEYGSF